MAHAGGECEDISLSHASYCSVQFRAYVIISIGRMLMRPFCHSSGLLNLLN